MSINALDAVNPVTHIKKISRKINTQVDNFILSPTFREYADSLKEKDPKISSALTTYIDIRSNLDYVLRATHFSSKDMREDAVNKSNMFTFSVFDAWVARKGKLVVDKGLLRAGEVFGKPENKRLVDPASLQDWEILMQVQGKEGPAGPKGFSTLRLALKNDLVMREFPEFSRYSEENREIGPMMLQSMQLAKQEYATTKYPIFNKDDTLDFGRRLEPDKILTVRVVVPVSQVRNNSEYMFLDLPYEEATALFRPIDVVSTNQAEESLPGVEMLLRGVVPKQYQSRLQPISAWHTLPAGVENDDYEPPVMSLGLKLEGLPADVAHPIESNEYRIAVGILPTYRNWSHGSTVRRGYTQLFLGYAHGPQDGVPNRQFADKLAETVFDTGKYGKYARSHERDVPLDFTMLPKTRTIVQRPPETRDHDPYAGIRDIGPRKAAELLGVTKIDVTAEMPATQVEQMQAMMREWNTRRRTSLYSVESDVPVKSGPLFMPLYALFGMSHQMSTHSASLMPGHPSIPYKAWEENGRVGEKPRLGILPMTRIWYDFLFPIEVAIRQHTEDVEQGQLDKPGFVAKLQQLVPDNLPQASALERGLRILSEGYKLAIAGEAPITKLAAWSNIYKGVITDIATIVNNESTNSTEGKKQFSPLQSLVHPGDTLTPIQQIAEYVDFGSAGAAGVDSWDGLFDRIMHQTIHMGDPFTWLWVTRVFLQENASSTEAQVIGNKSDMLGTFLTQMQKMKNEPNMEKEMRDLVHSGSDGTFALVEDWLKRVSDAMQLPLEQSKDGKRVYQVDEIPIYTDKKRTYTLLQLWESSGSNVLHRKKMQEIGNVLAAVWASSLSDTDASGDLKVERKSKLLDVWKLYCEQKIHVTLQRVALMAYVIQMVGEHGEEIKQSQLGFLAREQRKNFPFWLFNYIKAAHELRVDMANVIHGRSPQIETVKAFADHPTPEMTSLASWAQPTSDTMRAEEYFREAAQIDDRLHRVSRGARQPVHSALDNPEDDYNVRKQEIERAEIDARMRALRVVKAKKTLSIKA